MTDVTEFPHFVIEASELANWVGSQEGIWWNVDGDTKLMSKLNFPCPSIELAAELKKIANEMFAYDWRDQPEAKFQKIDGQQFEELANTDNNSKCRTFLLSWSDSAGTKWLLSEDLDAARDAAEAV